MITSKLDRLINKFITLVVILVFGVIAVITISESYAFYGFGYKTKVLIGVTLISIAVLIIIDRTINKHQKINKDLEGAIHMLKNKKIYTCGKMSGIKDFNRPRFNEVAKELRADGHTVFNPAEIVGEPHWEWSDYMREALKGMMDCDEVYVLKGHETSAGANIEIKLATELGMPVNYEKEYAEASTE